LLKDGLSYPEVWKSAVLPLLTSPHATVFFHLAVFAGLVCIGFPRRFEHRFLQNRSWAARLLLLLGVALVLSAAESYYKAARYIYFIYGIGLLCVLEVLQELHRRSGRVWRGAIVAMGALLLVAVELPAAIRQLPGADGRPARSPVAWLPDYGTRAKLARDRHTHERDYREAGKWLSENLHPGDLLLADAAHQMQPYVTTIHGHLAPPHHEYALGFRHYFTGSVLLRTPEELEDFLEQAPSQTRAWIVLTGYNSLWTDLLPPALAASEAWSKGPVHIYSVTVDTLRLVAHDSRGAARPAA
jgi:hypothetical protein